jgi:hypothetical protein
MRYIFDYQTDGRGSDCYPDYLGSAEEARRVGLAFVAEHCGDAVSWSIRAVDRHCRDTVIERGEIQRRLGQ